MAVLGGAIAGGAMLGSALIGSSAAKDQAAAAAAAQREALGRLDAIDIPSVQAQQIELARLKATGQLTPEMEQAIAAQQTQLANVTTDPRLRQAQLNALAQLSAYGQTPFTQAEQAGLRDARNQVAQQEQARQQSILQSLAQRGQLGSGMELAARLQSSQSAGNQASAESDRLTQMAQQRMLESLAQSGQLSGQIQAQDFSQQAEKARAADLINQFNTANARDVQQRNVASSNMAQSGNLAEKQRVADTNVNLQNQQNQYNSGLIQQNFQNQVQKAGGAASLLNNQYQTGMAGAANTANSWNQMGQGVGQLALGFSKLGTSKKTNADDEPTGGMV
jgi:hypothetical protein